MALNKTIILLILTTISILSWSANSSETDPVQKTEAVEYEPQVQVIALFKNKAMVDYAGKQKLYRAGQNISPQIKLIKADTSTATFMIDNEVVELGIGLGAGRSREYESVSTVVSKNENKKTPPKQVVRIVRGNHGHFITGGFINGISVQFLVDTGATYVSMSEAHAKQIGLSYRLDGIKSYASTANGVIETWNIVLKKVSIGGVELRNVNASVNKSRGMPEILLGMSFLNRVKVEYEGPLLTVTQKF